MSYTIFHVYCELNAESEKQLHFENPATNTLVTIAGASLVVATLVLVLIRRHLDGYSQRQMPCSETAGFGYDFANMKNTSSM